MNRAIAALLTGALTLGALTACTSTQPDPTPTHTTSPTVAQTVPSSPTPTTPSPTPTTATPTQTPKAPPPLTDDQTAARDVVLELLRLQNQFGMDDTLMDYTPITMITTGDAQWQILDEIERYRLLGAIQTAPVAILPTGVGQPRVDDAGTTVIAVSVCADATNVDMVDKSTGKSVYSGKRNPVNIFTLDVIKSDGSWLVSDITSSPTKACS